ncbi:chemotaxis protein CheD [Thiomonas sp.]|jgi:chemotaxis protein CheD|uniref:chemotaxis protein CheD n=1 Tax=Thiomonas sp. TaxID=2047785 RepID=UPI00258649E9|nr:chemotaxis protein CheD [Thiomonas sp.]
MNAPTWPRNLAIQEEEPLEIFLQPGELYFGEGRTRVRTLLGSCVAVTVWHSRLKIGGMCHYMLPSRARQGRHGHDALDGKYADEAMLMFLRSMRAARTRPEEYDAKLFGGGRMFGHAHRTPHAGYTDVPLKNVLTGRELVRQHGLKLKAEHLGGQGHRNLMFEIWSGDAYLKFWGQDAQQRTHGQA